MPKKYSPCLLTKRLWPVVLLSIFIFLPIRNPLWAAESGEEVVKQETVYAGVYINQIFEVSLKDNRFSVDFYVWFRWLGDDINPLESFEVVNGRIDSKESIYTDKIKGFNYGSNP